MVLGVAIIAFLLWSVNTGQLIQIFISVNPIYLILSLAMTVIVVFLKSVKWKIIVGLRQELPLISAVKFFLIGFFFSIITPGRLGDFVRAKYIRQKTGLAFSVTSVFLDRLIDIGILLSASLISAILFASVAGIGVEFIAIILLLGLIFVLGVYFISRKKTGKIIVKLFSGIFEKLGFARQVTKGAENIFDSIQLFKSDKKTVAKSAALGVIAWIASIFAAYLISLSIGMNLGLYWFFIMLPLIILTDILPINIGGLGTRELASITLFGLIGVVFEQAFAFSLLYYFVAYLSVGFVGGFVYLSNTAETEEK